jgi:hypothetical protein
VQNASAEPGAFRTEGESHIIVHQGRLDRDWWVTTRGTTRPSRSERNFNSRTERQPASHTPSLRTIPASPAGPSQRPDAERVSNVTAPRPANGGWSFGTAVSIQPSPLASRACAPPGGYALEGRGYLGTSPPNPTDVAPPMAATGEFRAWRGLPNTLGTVVEVTRHYSFADTSTWAVGLRNMLGG